MLIPRSIRLNRIAATVVMMVDPPGLPTARNGAPSSSTVVGLIELRDRLPGAGRLGPSPVELKSVGSLLSWNRGRAP